MPNPPSLSTANEFVQFLNSLEPASESSVWGGRVFINRQSKESENQTTIYSLDSLLIIFKNIKNDPRSTPSEVESCRLELETLDCMDWNDPHPYLTQMKTVADKIFAYFKGTHLSKEKLLKAKPAIKQPSKMAAMAKKIAYSIPAFLLFIILSPALLSSRVWTWALLPATQCKIPDPDLVLSNDLVAFRRTEFDLKREDGPTLKAMLIKTRGGPCEPNIAAPVAVLFCQNANMMQNNEMLQRANEYNELGFNAVLFNYRGVGGSEGTPKSGQDLIDDGKAIVKAIQQGKIEGLGKIPDQDIILDGTSIGGAVALAVGKENPEMLVAASHTFSNWSAAAGSVVTNQTHAIVGIACHWLAACSRRAASLDNAKALQARKGSVTIIQTAGKDELLNEEVRLRVKKEHEGVEEEFLADLDHGDMPPFLHSGFMMQMGEPVREKLKAKLQVLAERHAESWQQVLQLKVNFLKGLEVYSQINRLSSLLETLSILKFAQNGKKCDLQYVQDLLDELAPAFLFADNNHLEACQKIVDEIGDVKNNITHPLEASTSQEVPDA